MLFCLFVLCAVFQSSSQENFRIINKMYSPFMVLQKQKNHTSLICRGCLVESGEMKNMYEWCLTDDFYAFTEVQINDMSNLSVLLCTKCEETLKSCKSFKQQCQHSNYVLKNMLESETKQANTTPTPDSEDIDYVLTEEKLTFMLTPPNKHIDLPLPCPFKCKQTYPNEDILMNHLLKKHNVKSDEFKIDIQYYCSYTNCKYHVDSYGFFNDRKLLNEHCEVHECEYQCVRCSLKFSEEMDYISHLSKCNVTIENKQIADSVTQKTPSKETENSIKCILLENQLILRICAPNTEAKLYLPCPYECRTGYIKKKDLLSHMVKQHHVNKNFTIILKYYCSFPNCSHYIKSAKECFFNERKFLNQHYTKKHRSKDFHCIECSRNFASESEFNRHTKHCNISFVCESCNNQYKTHERWLVHLMRKHPNLHKKYKDSKKSNKRKSPTNIESKKQKVQFEKLNDFICDSPKRSFATQTNPYINIRNDVTLPSWTSTVSTKKDEISTQTVFEDMLSLKSQNSEDDLFFSETVSLSDIQTQTIPVEFGLSRSDKETITSQTQLPEFTIKETQTCVCLYESPKPNFRLFDSFSSSPISINLTSTETQTADVASDCLNSTETQTCFNEDL